MLVLTRKQSEKIRIGSDITITVFKTKGNAVRLGIEAPAHIAILRGELVFKLAAEEPELDTASEESVGKSASVRQPVNASHHQQQPTTHWPATTVERTDTSRPLKSLIHYQRTKGATREQLTHSGL